MSIRLGNAFFPVRFAMCARLWSFHISSLAPRALVTHTRLVCSRMAASSTVSHHVLGLPTRGPFPSFAAASHDNGSLEAFVEAQFQDARPAAASVYDAMESNRHAMAVERPSSALGRRTAEQGLGEGAATRTVSPQLKLCDSCPLVYETMQVIQLLVLKRAIMSQVAADFSRAVWLDAAAVRDAGTTFLELVNGSAAQALSLEGGTVTSDAMLAIPEAFPQLEELDLSGMRGAALSAIATCAARIPSLCVISLDRIDPRALEAGEDGVLASIDAPDDDGIEDWGRSGASAAMALGHVRSLSCKHFPPMLSLQALMPVLEAVLAAPSSNAALAAGSDTEEDHTAAFHSDSSGGDAAGAGEHAEAAVYAPPGARAKAAALASARGGLEARVAEAARRVALLGDAPLAWETLDAAGTVASLDARATAPLLPDGPGQGAPFSARHGLSDAGLAIIGAAAPRLRSVSLAFTSAVGHGPRPRSPSPATAAATGAPGSTESDLAARTGVSDRGLELLVAGVCGPRLTSIDVSGCSWLGDAGLAALGRRCPSLRFLNLAACTGVSDDGILSLVSPRGCIMGLEAINLTRCEGVSAAGVRRLLMGAPRCHSIVVTRSGAGVADDLESLASSFPKVQFATRDPRCYVDPSSSQLVPGFKAPMLAESFDRRVRNKLGIRVAKSKKDKKGKGKKR